MPVCYYCGQESSDLKLCNQCKQYYCKRHLENSMHDCPLIPIENPYETLQPQIQSSSKYIAPQDEITDETIDEEETYVYTDGSYVWYKKSPDIPENAFDPESGIQIPGILWPKKSEFIHVLIASVLLFLLAATGFFTQYSGIGIDLSLLFYAVFFLSSMYLLAFLVHEFSHRQVARHFKMQTKFRLFKSGMIMTLIFLFLPIKFALPGAVVVLGLENIGYETGLCKLAGPLSNLILGTIIFVISFFPFILFPLNWFLLTAASFNFQLGAFNMLPFGILDGDNIRKWKPKVWFLFFLLLLTLSAMNIILMNNKYIYSLFSSRI
ncbi:MAG: hypothetical protein ACTSWY_00930 [Promethearchaeota archaeon]